MIAWTTVEAALHALVVAGTGLTSGQVIWAQQNSPRPTGAYVAMRVSSVRALGLDWQEVEDTVNPDPGDELTLRRSGPRAAALSLQCFAGPDGPGVGASTPAALLDHLAGVSRLESRRAALRDAGVGILGWGAVQSIDGIIGGVFEPRAVVEARLLLGSEVEEFSTYVETVEVTNDLTAETFVVTLEAP